MTPKRSNEADRKVDGVGSLLDEAEGRVARKKPQAATLDLDVDKAWNRE